jgi:MYXO-CTERM domain-containing protein
MPMPKSKSYRGIKNQFVSTGLLALALPFSANAGVQFYGDENVLNSGATYASDPTAGATLAGLAPGVTTAATLITPHSYPFVPDAGDFPGTDQIYVGSVQTASHDGYSSSPERIIGPDELTLDYSGLISPGSQIQTFTLGIAFDDFQSQTIGNPFTLSINGQPNATLSALADSLDQTGPVVQFFTAGLDPSILNPNSVLNLSIDEGGDGGDGYALDFLTVGVTTVPEPAGAAMAVVAGLGVLRRRRRRSAADVPMRDPA